VPRPFERMAFLQYTSNARLKGMHGPFDRDVFYGGRAALDRIERA
jgi:GH25 family lysozyme M1 (1,4-beta-N-acetylmuramidase)